ncbi:hypothetical protein [Almyronema epifaneia]|uniref:Uncharacterized protein n=1 Tax=Almyronema epifaneia S1 TaxID=2991925 RepID=A0ABW6ILI3_9CYAN
MSAYQQELRQLVGARILATDLEEDHPDAYSHLVVELPNGDRCYVLTQVNTEGNGPGRLQLNTA